MTTGETASSSRADDLTGLFASTALHRQLGVSIESVPGGVRVAGPVGTAWARFDGAEQLHGGVVAILLDSALTFALVAETGRAWATVDLRVDYLRPVAIGDVDVVARTLRAGRTIGRAGAELRDRTGELCATAVAAFAAQPSP